MAASTTSTEGELLKEYWNEVFLTELRSNLVLKELALMGQHPKGEGSMVHWLSLGDMTAAAALTEATDPTEYTLSAGDLTATLKQYGASVLLSDLLQDTWIGGSMEKVMERLGRNAALTMDTVIRNACFTAGGLVQYCGTAVARNSIATDGSFDLDVAEIREAKASLERANVQPHPMTGTFVAVTHSDCVYDLQGDSNWTDVAKYAEMGKDGSNRLVTGEAGTLYGVKFMQSNQALKMDASGSASTDVYQTYLVGNEHFGISSLYDVQTIVKNPHPASDLDLYGSVGWKASFVAKELQNSAMIRIESGASLAD